MNVSADSVAQRVSRFLQRKIAVLSEVLAEVSRLPLPDEDGTLDDWSAVQDRFEASVAQLAEEHAILLREWRACTGVPDEIRDAVRTLSDEAEACAAALAAQYDAAIQLLNGRQEDCTRQLDQMRKNKSLMNRYLPRLEHEANYLDKKS